MTTVPAERTRAFTDLVAAEIRATMGRYAVRQSQLARRLGVNDTWISVRLRGVQPIDVNDLARIAEALGVEVVDLLPSDMVRPNKRSDALTDRPMSGPPRVKTHPNGRPRNNPTRPTSPVRASQRRPEPRRSSARRMAA